MTNASTVKAVSLLPAQTGFFKKWFELSPVPLSGAQSSTFLIDVISNSFLSELLFPLFYFARKITKELWSSPFLGYFPPF